MSAPAPPDAAASTPGAGYGPVLALLVVFPTVGLFGPDVIGVLLGVGLVVSLWFAITRATGMSRRTRGAGLVAAAGLVVLGGVAAATDLDALLAATEIATAVGIAALVAVLGRALLRDQYVTLSTVAGVLSIYLMLGLFYASAYQGVLHLDDGAFTSALVPLDRFEVLYFSFVTLTTVGFGDITPAVDATRALAMSEAMIGQLFLVTIVARVVALLGRRSPGSPRR